ncbi:MAG TPA: two-component regulator propeller domain-containing protein [Flavobacteriales bacterium]|nr:two-component regulator propeller domain-containing protein [Flavobacteriales bacterium]
MDYKYTFAGHMLYKLIKYSLVMLSLYAGNVTAQNPHPAFKQYTVEQGLPSTEIYQVKQDSKGYIWFATNNGVSRFNGYEFENFSMSNGLPDNTVFEIFEDAKGRIWFYSFSTKLSYYENGKIHLYKYNDVIQKHIKNPFKLSFCVDDKDNVYLGFAELGIYRIDVNGKIGVPAGIKQEPNTLNIIEPVANNLIFADKCTDRHTYYISFNTSSTNKRLRLNYLIHPRRIYARAIALKNGSYLFTVDNRLVYIDPVKGDHQIKFDYDINWLYEDRDGDLWVGTYLGGVFHIQDLDFEHKKQYLPNTTVDGVLQDNEGGFWFATEDNGVYYTASKQILTYDKTTGLSHDNPTCLGTDGNNLFVGMKNGYMHILQQNGELKTYDLNQNQKKPAEINAFFYDRHKKRLWASGGNNIFSLSSTKQPGKNGKPIAFYGMLRDQKGNYWACFVRGVSLIDTVKNKLLLNGSKQIRTYTMLEQANGRLWCGTINGLWEFNTNDSSFKERSDGYPQLRKRISHMAYLSDSALVIATRGAGVVIYHHKKVYQFNAKNGLGDDNVNRLCISGNTVWAATNSGLSRIDFKKEGEYNTYDIKTFTTFDGLASNEILDVVKVNEHVWAATRKGLSRLPANGFDPRYPVYPVRVAGVEVDDEPIALNKVYEIPYNHHNIKIRFIALGYRNTGKMQYRYRMSGINEKWVYTQNREIQFTTLPPHNYVFELSVRNADGSWSKSPVKINFTIQTPFWQTWWFRISAAGVFIYLVFVLLRYRFKRIQQQKEKNASLERSLLSLRLKALQAQMNPHFIFNVMNSIQHFIAYKNDEAAARYLSKFSRLVRTILQNSEETTVTVSEEIKALELYLELEAMRFEEAFTYTVWVDPGINSETTKIPSMLIQPYVENAILHGILPLKSGGELKIE